MKHKAELISDLISKAALIPLAAATLISSTLKRTFAVKFKGPELTVLPQRAIWIHAASVGEVAGVDPFIRALAKAYPDQPIVISTTSETGQEEIVRRNLSHNFFLLPFDLRNTFERLIETIVPKLVVIAETELWPNMLFALRRQRVPIVIVNARISDRTFPRYCLLRALFGPVVRCVDKILVQTATDQERFCQIGAQPSSVLICGSTKYDQVESIPFESKAAARKAFGLAPEVPTIVAGSVRGGEDQHVISAFLECREALGNLQLVIAPRHRERFEKTATLLHSAGLQFNRRSLYRKEGSALAPASVLLLDTIGELSSAYAAGDLAFIGGTLVPIGGHNPFEAARFGVPVVIGPHFQNVRDGVQSLKYSKGVFIVSNEAELARAFISLLSDPALNKTAGSGAKAAAQSHRGATERVLNELRPYLQSKPLIELRAAQD